jgi:hypothetical protein
MQADFSCSFRRNTMKTFFSLIFVLTVTIVHGQFAIINDTDGYVFVRETAETTDNIIDTIFDGQYFFCMELEGNWSPIDYNKNGEDRSGYIYSSRSKSLKEFTSINSRVLTENSLSLSLDSIQIDIETEVFDVKRNTLTYDTPNGYYLTEINHKQYYGSDGEVPKRQYEFIKIKIGQKMVPINGSEISDLFEPNLESTFATYDSLTHRLYLFASNSDGSGSYEVLWVIENGKYIKRVIAYGF